jgi:hypothetical protein
MAPHLVTGLAKKGSTTARWPREKRGLGYQSSEGVLKDVFTGDSDSGDDRVKLPGRFHSPWSAGPKPAFPRKSLWGSPRVQSFGESMQEQLWREDMDFIDERRWQATI